MLPISVSGIYLYKFLILAVMLLAAVALENFALMNIGITCLPQGTFEMGTLLQFAAYSFITSMPVLSFMLFISSRFENMWVPLGVGVAGFLSGMALGTSKNNVFLIDPFVIMLKPAVSMSAKFEISVAAVALFETLLFLGIGLWMAKNVSCE